MDTGFGRRTYSSFHKSGTKTDAQKKRLAPTTTSETPATASSLVRYTTASSHECGYGAQPLVATRSFMYSARGLTAAKFAKLTKPGIPSLAPLRKDATSASCCGASSASFPSASLRSPSKSKHPRHPGSVALAIRSDFNNLFG